MDAGDIAGGRKGSNLGSVVGFVCAVCVGVAACGGRVLLDDPQGGGPVSPPIAAGGLGSAGGAPLDASPPDDSPPDASPPDDSPPDDSAPDASPSDAAPPDSSPPDAASPNTDLPLASTPKRIRCGPSVCNIDASCCLSRPDPSELSPTLTACSNDFCSMRRECDQTADCGQGQICCYSVVSSPPAVVGSYCTVPANCGGGTPSWVACGTQADCSNLGAPPCMAQQCAGTIVQACGPIPYSACRNTSG